MELFVSLSEYMMSYLVLIIKRFCDFLNLEPLLNLQELMNKKSSRMISIFS